MNRIGLFAPAIAALVAACSTVPPPASPQLTSARAAYNHAARGPAPIDAPTQLRVAGDSLNRAQRANDIEDQYATDFAELARSRSQLADRDGRTVVATRDLDTAQRNLIAAQDAQLRDVSQRLGATEMQGGQAAVISAGLLFKTNSAELEPGVKKKLAQVADVLASDPKVNSVIVDGYTDDTGTPQVNEPLSEKRAAAVGIFLESHGISQDRITTRGFAAENPVTSNQSVEGRAMNRRVEIQVKRAGATPTQTSPTMQQPR
jgi:outer membrane protein OmpA-like peptidoglycan-associated protein